MGDLYDSSGRKVGYVHLAKGPGFFASVGLIFLLLLLIGGGGWLIFNFTKSLAILFLAFVLLFYLSYRMSNNSAVTKRLFSISRVAGKIVTVLLILAIFLKLAGLSLPFLNY